MAAKFFYNLSIFFLVNGIRIFSLFNPKAAKWVKGRQQWRKKLKDSIAKSFTAGNKVIWLHAASLGEFEQGKPVLEKLKQNYPDTNVIVSFFSPSGYEVSGNYAFADVICYLPEDTVSNAEDFIALVKPDIVLWMKYEYWWNMLGAVSGRNIPLILISAIYRKQQPFFRSYGGWFREQLKNFTHIFVQTKDSEQLICPYLPDSKISIGGDTRFDRVTEIAGKWQGIPVIEKWLNGMEKVWVAGSTWHEDEKVLMHLIKSRSDVKWIIAPHKTDTQSIKDTLSRFPNALKFSDIKEKNFGEPEIENKVLIIDNIGMLSRLYRYGSICYVGGGFNDSGIHNTLEAAVYGKPVVFGPVYEKFAEAVGLIETGGAISFETALELEDKLLPILESPEKLKMMGLASGQFVKDNAGATEKVVNYIYKNRLLTN